MSHKFAVGQKVNLVHRMLQLTPRGQYLVSRHMPDPERPNADPMYRIKSADESHERVAQESDLTATHPDAMFARDKDLISQPEAQRRS